MNAADHPLSPEDLMAYLDGELPVEQAAVALAHLTGCDVCQRLRVELRGVSRDLARWQVEDAPATLTAPPASESTKDSPRFAFGWLRLKPAFAYAGGAVAVVGVAGILLSARLINVRYASATASQSKSSRSEPATAIAGRPPTEGSPLNLQAAETGRNIAAVPNVLAGQPARPALPGPSIARTARLRLRTNDFDAARPTVERVVADTGGLVGQVNVSGTRGDARTLTATLLIPANRLDGALAALKAIGLVLEESQSGDDVTEQVVDIGARLSNARNTEKRLLDLLQKRTGDLADVLAAEREIARVREEIERVAAQQKNLERRVTYATLDLAVTEQQHAALDLGPQPVSGMFRDALVTGITDAIDSALGLCLLIVRVGPILLLWITLLAWPAWAIVRRSRRTV